VKVVGVYSPSVHRGCFQKDGKPVCQRSVLVMIQKETWINYSRQGKLIKLYVAQAVGIIKMANETLSDERAEQLIRACARTTFRPVLRLIYEDPHQWSDRPCATCRTITSLLGEKFGCYIYHEENKKG